MRSIVKTSLIFYTVLLAVVWSLPLAFTACSIGSKWCYAAYWLTESAGKYGTLVIVLISGYLYTIRLATRPEKIKAFAKVVCVLLAVLAVFAFVNEHLTKKLLRSPRPSHAYILNEAGRAINLDSLYQLEKEQRQAVFNGLIQASPVLTATIDKKVLDHWVEEAGYSFPSGHSFNAFLLASILAFGIRQTRFKKWFFLPFVWACCIAVSRVAIGAHTALDVSVGAAMGGSLGLLFLYFDSTRQVVTRKKSNQ